MRDIAILGAGPYGLSLAAHLGAAQADMRVFGHPMQSWKAHMPQGMCLKSEGFASTLYDPEGAFTYEQWCEDAGVGYRAIGLPVRLDHFSAYGEAFQQRFVPQLERKLATKLETVPGGFAATFDDGERATFRRVVLAIGIQPFAVTAADLRDLPSELLSHSADHHDMGVFAGRRVLVVGGGSSATDCAASLALSGAQVEIAARGPALRFHAPPKPRRPLDGIRWPLTTIGTGWRSAFCAWTPDLFHALPQKVRHDATRRHLGPVGCWFTRDTIENRVRVHTGATIVSTKASGGKALVTISQAGQQSTVEVDHVIAATGYKVDLDRLRFLDSSLRARIACAEKTPVLTRRFESSVPGLFFVGVTAANAFGPLLRFACGAEFASSRLARHLAPSRSNAKSRPSRPEISAPA